MTKRIIILLIGCLFISPVYAKKKYTDKQNKMFHAGGLKKKHKK